MNMLSKHECPVKGDNTLIIQTYCPNIYILMFISFNRINLLLMKHVNCPILQDGIV